MDKDKLKPCPFSTGQQPCDNFKPMKDGNQNGTWDNRHQCMRCEVGTVSFCENCKRDHHIDGWDNCSEEIKKLCEKLAGEEDANDIRKILPRIAKAWNTRAERATPPLDIDKELEVVAEYFNSPNSKDGVKAELAKMFQRKDNPTIEKALDEIIDIQSKRPSETWGKRRSMYRAILRNLAPAERAEKDVPFIAHIQEHLEDGQVVICKICGKTAREITAAAPAERGAAEALKDLRIWLIKEFCGDGCPLKSKDAECSSADCKIDKVINHTSASIKTAKGE